MNCVNQCDTCIHKNVCKNVLTDKVTRTVGENIRNRELLDSNAFSLFIKCRDYKKQMSYVIAWMPLSEVEA